MTKHLTKFTGLLTEKYWPTVPCPTCDTGNLKLEGSVQVVWASHVMTHPAYPPLAEIEHGGRFTAHLRCDDGACQEGAVVAGRAYVDEQWENPSEREYQTFLTVHFFEPPLRLIDTPEATPDAVASAIRAASMVMWASPSSGANRLRGAVEELLDDQGVAPGNLHHRILQFKQTNEKLGLALMAVKYIGNEGSHQDVHSTSDILEDAGILEHVVVALYGTGAAALEAKIQAVIDAQGIANKS